MQALTVFESMIGGGIGAAISTAIFAVLVWFFRSYIGNYLMKKAENLATKEDIEIITRLQEDVKAEFALLLETQRTEARLRLAVIERRFQAHQEAHTLWLELFHNVHSKDNPSVVMKCQEWWEKNSLYLDPKPRAAFPQAYKAAFNHPGFVRNSRNKESVKLINKNWQQIIDAGPIIEAAVNLPSLDSSERERPGKPEPTAFPDGE